MRKPYEDVELPKWVREATKEQLTDHIKYLSHNCQTLSRHLQRARYRYRKAEKQVKEQKEMVNEHGKSEV